MDANDERRGEAAPEATAPHRDSVFHHDDHPSVGDHIGEAAGGISGVLAGAAIGAAGGPIGTIIGGIAGAVGGWWAGRTVSEAATHMTGGDSDAHYRHHYEGTSDRLADRSYDDVRPAYQLGHLAAMNPDYRGRDFEGVEPELRHGWSDEVRARHGDWQRVRGYARDAFVENRARMEGTGRAVAGAGGDLDPLARPGPDDSRR
jgi:hypothetical protein